MTDARDKPPSLGIRDEANDWVARRQSGWSATSERTLSAWLDRDPSHRRAYREALADWEIGSELTASTVGQSRKLRRAPFLQRRNTRLAGAGLGIVASACVATLWLLPSGGPMPMMTVANAEYRTGIGEIRAIKLPDGSGMILDTTSSAAVSFGTSERRVTLLQGRARFAVNGHDRRPFVVGLRAGGRITGGDRFGVSLAGGHPVIAALRGSILLKGLASTASPALIDAGQQLELGTALSTEPISPATMQWVKGMLVFDDTPLADAIDQLNRYNNIQIDLGSASPERQVSGAFQARDPEGFCEAVAKLFGLRVGRSGDRISLSEPRSSGVKSSSQK